MGGHTAPKAQAAIFPGLSASGRAVLRNPDSPPIKRALKKVEGQEVEFLKSKQESAAVLRTGQLGLSLHGHRVS